MEGRPTIVKQFKVFGNKCYIKRGDDDLGKFDSRTDGSIFLGHSYKRKVFQVSYDLILNKIVESANIRVDDTRSKRVKLQTNELP